MREQLRRSPLLRHGQSRARLHIDSDHDVGATLAIVGRRPGSSRPSTSHDGSTAIVRPTATPGQAAITLAAAVGLTVTNSVLHLIPGDGTDATLPVASAIALGIASLTIPSQQLNSQAFVVASRSPVDRVSIVAIEVLVVAAALAVSLLWARTRRTRCAGATSAETSRARD